MPCSFMRQDWRLGQKVVVCKMAVRAPDEAQVLQSPRFARKLSCCLQDAPRRGRLAKHLQRNASGPKLRCCLQDCRVFACGRGASAADGYAQPLQDVSGGIASGSPGSVCAISADCRGNPPGIRDRRRFFLGGSGCAAAAESVSTQTVWRGWNFDGWNSF